MKSSPAQNLAKLLIINRIVESISQAGIDIVSVEFLKEAINNLEAVIVHMQTGGVKPDQAFLQELGLILTKYEHQGRDHDT